MKHRTEKHVALISRIKLRTVSEARTALKERQAFALYDVPLEELVIELYSGKRNQLLDDIALFLFEKRDLNITDSDYFSYRSATFKKYFARVSRWIEARVKKIA